MPQWDQARNSLSKVPETSCVSYQNGALAANIKYTCFSNITISASNMLTFLVHILRSMIFLFYCQTIYLMALTSSALQLALLSMQLTQVMLNAKWRRSETKLENPVVRLLLNSNRCVQLKLQASDRSIILGTNYSLRIFIDRTLLQQNKDPMTHNTDCLTV